MIRVSENPLKKLKTFRFDEVQRLMKEAEYRIPERSNSR
jgi:hypothetical protein